MVIHTLLAWSEEEHLHLMQTTNTTKSYLSISSPGTHLVAGDDALGCDVMTYCNNYGADLKRRYPDKFGLFASLTLPDVENSLREISRAYLELDADGFVLETNHHGIYLGDSKFDAVFDELNKRHAVLLIHPDTPCMVTDSIVTQATPLAPVPHPIFEFFFDTARAVINLFLSGTVARCPNITFIVPHMGGAFPPLIRRFSTFAGWLDVPGPKLTPEWVIERLNGQFYFDSAGLPFPEQIHGLLQYVTVDRMVFGSDYCYTPSPMAQRMSQDHERFLPQIFSRVEDREKLCSKNAKRLFAKNMLDD